MTEEEIFQQARRIADEQQRDSFLHECCENDPVQLARLIKLLKINRQQPQFLETPVLNFSETVVEDPQRAVGQTIDKYQLQDLVGEGGFGLVYKAQQLRPIERAVAIKVIKPGMDSQQVVARFSLEQQALARMSHPNIAAIFDCGQTAGGRLWFAMEFVPGLSISQYSDQHRLPLADRVRLLIDVCAAVEHAHQKGIIHRDLKPSNILVCGNGTGWQLKVIDFGIARAVDQSAGEKSRLTRGAQLMGTPLYMSPEQTAGDSSDIDTRADIYSIGAVFYELVTGGTPFERLTTAEVSWEQILHEIREVEPQRLSAWLASDLNRAAKSAERLRATPSRLIADCRRDLDWIVLKCLEKDRSRRYRTVGELREDLERYLQGDVVQAGPPTLLVQWRKYWKRNQRAMVFVAAVVLALTLGLVASLSQAYRASRAEKQAKQDRDAERAARLEADQQTQVSQAVTNFLTEELLQQADIANQLDAASRDPELTVRAVLLRAISRIPGRFDAMPQVEVAIRDTLANSLLGIGEFQPALQQARLAVEIAEKYLGEDDPQRLRIQQVLATLLTETEHPAEAIEILQRLESHYRQAVGPDHANTLRIRLSLAKALDAAGKLAEAERHIKEVLAICESRPSDDQGQTLNARYNLALLLSKMGKADQAEGLLRTIAGERSSIYGESHPLAIKATHSLAVNLHVQGKRDEAEPFYQQAESLAQEYLGPDHPITLSVLNDFGNLYAETNRRDRALEMYQLVLELRTKKLGEHNPATWDAMNNLAIHHAEDGKVDLALEIFVKVVALRKQYSGPGHVDTLLAQNNLALLYQSMDQFQQAVDIYSEAWENSKIDLSPNHPLVIAIGTQYANGLAQLAEWERSAAVMRETLELIRQNFGEQSGEHATQLGRLALVVIEMDGWEEAEQLAVKALEIRREVSPERWATGWAQSLLGRIQFHRGEIEVGLQNLESGAEFVSAHWDQVASNGQGNAVQAFDWLIEAFEQENDRTQMEKWRDLREKLLHD